MGQFTRAKGYSGVLVHDERIRPENWSSGPTEYTEADPRPGQSVPALGTVKATVRTHGSQGDTTYVVNGQRGGFGPNASFAWSQVTDGVETSRRGWNSPNFAQDFLFIGGGITADEVAGTPAVVTTGSGRMVWFYVIENSAHSPTTYAVCCSLTDLFTINDISGTDSSLVIMHDDPTDGYYSLATYYGSVPDGLDCVCARWDDERSVIQLFVRVVGAVSGDRQFFLFESSDAASWSLVQRDCCASSFSEDETLRPPSVAKLGGCTTIIQPDNDNASTFTAIQLVSYDNGRNFTTPYGRVTVEYQEYALCEHLGTVVCAARNGTTDAVHSAVLGSLSDDISQAVITDIESPSAGFDISLCSFNDTVWLACIDEDGLTVVLRSSQTGAYSDWLSLGFNPLTFESSASGIASNYVKIQPGLGGLMLTLAPTGVNVPVGLDGHLVAIRCGGWAAVTLPAAGDSSTTTGRIAFGPIAGIGADPHEHAMYYPMTLPEDLDRGGSPLWVYSSSGSPTAPSLETSLTLGHRLKAPLTASGTVKYHQWVSDFDGDIDTGVMVYFDGNVSASTNNDSAVVVYAFDGTNLWGCVLQFGPGPTAAFVNHTVTDSITLGDVTTRYQYIIAMRRALPGDTNAVATLYRTTTTTTNDRFGWEQMGSIVCNPSVSATAAGMRVTIRHTGSLSDGVTYTSNLVVYALHYRAYTGIHLLDDLATQPALGDYLYGAPCCSAPVELSDGFRVSFTGGPVAKGDQWTIAPRFSYAKEHLYTALYPSPREEWRSTGDNVTATLKWTLNADDAPEGLASTSMGIMLQGINFPEFVVEGMEPGGTWTTLMDVSTYAEFSSLKYSAGVSGGVTGPFVKPGITTTSAARYIHENELAGATLNIALGGGSFRKVRVTRNTGGYWSNNTTAGKKCRIFLDPNDWTGDIPATGTMDIWPSRVLAMKHGLGDEMYRRLRIVIAANQTASDDYRIGAMVIGPLYVFGWSSSFGRKLSRQNNTTLTTYLGGSKTAVVNGPNPRAVEFGWFEGVDGSFLDSSSEDDYVTVTDDSTSADAVAARHDIATTLEGLYDYMNGPANPLTYVAKIPFSDDVDTATVITSPEFFIYGRITSSIERNTIRGEEGVSEVTAIGPITFEEDV